MWPKWCLKVLQLDKKGNSLKKQLTQKKMKLDLKHPQNLEDITLGGFGANET